jgi:glycosyltransferase involved in cell wall biosynthesis
MVVTPSDSPADPGEYRPCEVVVAAGETGADLAAAALGATSELILFLDGRARPVGRRWLAALVAGLGDHASVGATILRPVDARKDALRVIHDGAEPVWGTTGVDVIDRRSDEPRRLPGGAYAVRAAAGSCLLVRTGDLRRVGGVDPEMPAAWWDVDLCLRLDEAGLGVAVSHDVFMFLDVDLAERRRRDPDGRIRLGERWAPGLARTARLDDLDEPGRTARVAAELSRFADLTAAGWHLVSSDEAVDLAVNTRPEPPPDRLRSEPAAAIVERLADWNERPGFDEYEAVVVAAKAEAADLDHRVAPIVVTGTSPRLAVEAVREAWRRPRIGWRIGSPATPEAERWGDTHLARHMAAAARTVGFASRITPLPMWDHPAHQDVDLAIHLHGLKRYRPKPGHVNVLWVISHAELLTADQVAGFDLMLVASELHAAVMAREYDVAVRPFLQATDLGLFHPDGSERDIPLLFVGNSRKQRRPMIEWALERGLPLTIYGGDWEGFIPDQVVAGRFVPNHEIPALYRRARIMLNDHWPGMAAAGFVSNRAFDALACQTPVISDPVAGMQSALPDGVVTIDSADALEHAVRTLLADEDERRRLGRSGCDIVRARHSTTARAGELVTILESLRDDIPKLAAILERRLLSPPGTRPGHESS